MKGALPPSSKPSRFIVAELCLYKIFPTAVDPIQNYNYLKRPFLRVTLNYFSRTEMIPVNDIPATCSLVQSFSPTPGVFSRLDVTTLITPGGIPASFATSARSNADNGVSSAGFITQVHPLAIAAAAFLAIMAVGKFHYNVICNKIILVNARG